MEEEKKSDDFPVAAELSAGSCKLAARERPPPDKPKKTPSSAVRVGLCLMMRILILDLPVLVSFSLYVATIELEKIGSEFLIPQHELQRFTPEKAETDLTYYHRTCDASDLTANDTSDFVFDQDIMQTNDAVHLMSTQGAVVFPKLLRAETAHDLREFILQENKVSRDLIYVIENQNRWSFPITVDQHPSVSAALEEILNQQHLVDALEAIVGTDPAVIEFTAITSAYGAVGQFWHQDGEFRPSQQVHPPILYSQNRHSLSLSVSLNSRSGRERSQVCSQLCSFLFLVYTATECNSENGRHRLVEYSRQLNRRCV